jgi:uncharacterized membrane protein YtjA (UPF0391 family)
LNWASDPSLQTSRRGVRSAAAPPATGVIGRAVGLRKENEMLYWALIFFVVALIAGAFGFGGIASASAGIAQILFVIFLVLLVVSLVMHFMRRRV